MRIAKLNIVTTQTTSQGIIDHYLCVPNNYDFDINNADDMTSIDNLMIFHLANRFDYQVFRDSIKEHVVPNWNALTWADKQKCVFHYRYPLDISDEEWYLYYTENEHEHNWRLMVDRTRNARLMRLFAAFEKVSYRLNEMQVATIYTVTKELCYDYYYANLPHILIWLQNGTYPPLGIDYTNSGFAQMSGYTPEIASEVLDIFVNGNYTKY